MFVQLQQLGKKVTRGTRHFLRRMTREHIYKHIFVNRLPRRTLLFKRVFSSTYCKCRDEAADSPLWSQTAGPEHLLVLRPAGCWHLGVCSSPADPHKHLLAGLQLAQQMLLVRFQSGTLCNIIVRLTHTPHFINYLSFRSMYYQRGSLWLPRRRLVRPQLGPCILEAPGTGGYSSP